MFKMIQSTAIGSNCTCEYIIELDKEYTVREFIDTILKEKNREWGYIGIKCIGTIFGKPYCEYSHGSLKYNLPTEILDKKVNRATASGGWSRMDYLIDIH